MGKWIKLGERMASTNSTTKEKTRQTWDKDAMANAIKAIRDKQMVFLKASKTNGIPKTTLIRSSKMEDQLFSDVTNHKLGRKSTLSSELKAELCDYILEIEKSRFGLTCRDIRSLFNVAYIRSQRAELAISGFRATGIYPVNRHVSEDHDFIDEDLPTVEGPSNVPARDITTPVDKIPDIPIHKQRAVVPEPDNCLQRQGLLQLQNSKL